MSDKLKYYWLIAPSVLVVASCGGGGSSLSSPVVTPTGPNANSVQAATATAQNNALCGAPVRPFYWEIGDSTGALVSGSEGTAANNNPVLASTKFSIASASKLVYGAYVAQLRGAAANLTAQDISFLHFTSGYSNMGETGGCLAPLTPNTVNECLTRQNSSGVSFSAQDPATIGKFDYDGGHMENHASQFTLLGNVDAGLLGPTVEVSLGLGVIIVYTQPLMAGGIYASADGYAPLLRHILDGSLAFKDALGTNPVCTLPSATCNAVFSPVPEAWHYSIGHWVEDDPGTHGDGAFSSAGAFGFYPWIDSSKQYYGIISREASTASGENQGYASAQCGRLIRRAWMTGIEQTGTLPSN